MHIVPMRDLKDTVKIENLCSEGEPVFVTKNGYGKLVVMDMAYYESTLQKVFEAQMINKGLDDVKNGRVIDGETVLAAMKGKYGV